MNDLYDDIADLTVKALMRKPKDIVFMHSLIRGLRFKLSVSETFDDYYDLEIAREDDSVNIIFREVKNNRRYKLLNSLTMKFFNESDIKGFLSYVRNVLYVADVMPRRYMYESVMFTSLIELNYEKTHFREVLNTDTNKGHPI